jgi:hypothetical protein
MTKESEMNAKMKQYLRLKMQRKGKRDSQQRNAPMENIFLSNVSPAKATSSMCEIVEDAWHVELLQNEDSRFLSSHRVDQHGSANRSPNIAPHHGRGLLGVVPVPVPNFITLAGR